MSAAIVGEGRHFSWLRIYSLAILIFALFMRPANAFEVIAHRGASGYLPENTREAFAYAHAQRADWLESDIVATRDDHLLVNHDLWLETTTDIAARFPTRKRADGHFYARDFSLEEIENLRITPRADANSARFPDNGAVFHPISLETEISLVQGLNFSTKREVGFYLEIKDPQWHRANGADVSALVLALLAKHNVKNAILESFDALELRRLKTDLKAPFALTQLIGTDEDGAAQNQDFAAMQTPEGLQKIAGYAQTIAPHLSLVVGLNFDGTPKISGLVANAHAANLEVAPYVFQADQAPFAPPLTRRWLQILRDAKIDALFCDQPDVVNLEKGD